MKNEIKCSVYNCGKPAIIKRIFVDVAGLGICSFNLCKKCKDVSPFNCLEDILSEEIIGEVIVQ